MSLFEWFVKGGPVMIPILMCSIAGLAVFVERIWSIRRAEIDRDQFVKGIRNIIRKEKIAEAVSICEQTHGPVAAIIRAGLLKNGRPKDEVREAMETAASVEFPKLKRNMILLATVTQVSPLLGLLGTATGMVNAFMVIHQKGGIVNAADLAQGIYEALFTTVGGLMVAIPCFVAYNYIHGRIQKIVTDMEIGASEILNAIFDTGSDYEA